VTAGEDPSTKPGWPGPSWPNWANGLVPIAESAVICHIWSPRNVGLAQGMRRAAITQMCHCPQ
jgi:hypothetical protein